MSVGSTVRIAFLDVGQGDTIVVSLPQSHEAVVVDCVNPHTVFSYLQDQKVTRVRALVITHLHVDHYRGVVRFLKNCSSELNVVCEKVLYNWPSVPSRELDRLLRDADRHSEDYEDERQNRRQRQGSFRELLDWAESTRGASGSIESNQPFLEGKISEAIQVLHPWHEDIPRLQAMGLNNTSVVLKIQGAGSSALLTGDLEPDGWHRLRANVGCLHADVLKFPHHGAWKNGDAAVILDDVKPSYVTISVGTEGRKYDHPSAHVLGEISKRRSVVVLCTQATTQCENDLLAKRDHILKQLAKRHGGGYCELRETTNSCPCAGSIIIDLDQVVTVVEPNIATYRREIVNSFSTHLC